MPVQACASLELVPMLLFDLIYTVTMLGFVLLRVAFYITGKRENRQMQVLFWIYNRIYSLHFMCLEHGVDVHLI